MQDNNTLPKINMVFHGEHSSWVFGKMLRLYQEAAKGKYTIIPSIDPKPGCDVYQYWRPVSPQALKTIQYHAPNSEYYTKGIQMMHDSPYDNIRHKTVTRQKTLANYKYIMCTSQEQMDFYSDKVSSDKLKYLPLGVFAENCVWHAPRTEGKIRIGFVARYYHDRVKGEELVFQIAKKLDPAKYEFVIRCPNNGVLATRIKRLRFNVSSSGDFDVLLICSKYEGTPLPLLEAMTSGIYVLSTHVGESPVLLESKHLCDNSAYAFVNKLNELEQNRQLLVDAMPVLKDKVKDRTWERFINDSMALWDSIINKTHEPISVNDDINEITLLNNNETTIKQDDPIIFENTPYRSDKDLVYAYNSFMELLPDNAWALFRDADTLFLDSFYGNMLVEVIKRYPNTGCFTAIANRPYSPYGIQVCQDYSGDDVNKHRAVAEMLRKKFGSSCAPWPKEKRTYFSGFCFLLNKQTWKAIGGFKQWPTYVKHGNKILGVDNKLHYDLMQHNFDMKIMKGVYVYHWYRGGDDGEPDHLL